MEKGPQLNRDQKNEYILEALNQLRYLKDAYKPEIPDEILCGVSPDKNYKVRKNWWAGLFVMLDQRILPLLSGGNYEELTNTIKQFEQDYGDEKFKNRLTTEDDIERADSLIKEIILILENL
ncbi:MAG: hypothetical protein WC693_00725 [Patescibacteria group bacterium]|jgi:hypothetical protein